MGVEDVPTLHEQGDEHYERRELDRARNAWRRAADQGDALAMAKLASLYEEQADLPAAEHWYRLAATAGHVVSAHNLAFCWRTEARKRPSGGTGRPRPPATGQPCTEQARRWVRHAAEGGDVESMFVLARVLFYAGQHEEAACWGLMAAARGHAEAKEMFAIAPIEPLPSK
jgi:TPR repeat protein